MKDEEDKKMTMDPIGKLIFSVLLIIEAICFYFAAINMDLSGHVAQILIYVSLVVLYQP